MHFIDFEESERADVQAHDRHAVRLMRRSGTLTYTLSPSQKRNDGSRQAAIPLCESTRRHIAGTHSEIASVFR